MNKCEVIAYWLMGKDLCEQAIDNYTDIDTIINAVASIEDNPRYQNVGRFSHPNEKGYLQLDAAYMEGNGKVGAVIETSHIVNPILVAKDLSRYRQNIVLCADGADEYASRNGFAVKEQLEICAQDLEYPVHDTFGVIQFVHNEFRLAITTSGRKGKTLGRVGDTPLIGSGFYCENGAGACIATGDGEACLRNVMAKEVVDRLGLGESINGVCRRVLDKGLNRLDYETELSLIAVDKDGYFDAASSFEVFPFSYIYKGQIYDCYCYRNEIRTQDELFENLYHGD